jgi:crotonobetainyl-CoA:carnitine CoA-transferase CaiB-like acyl-CoA transferase
MGGVGEDGGMTSSLPLSGVRIVSIAINLPGPVAAARLASMGASVTKVEPPSGDPLTAMPELYAELVAGQQVETVDLKESAGQERLHALLADADVLITSHRGSARLRLGLDWDSLHAKHPRLCQVAIVGHASPEDDLPGHDLTYQAVNGMLAAPAGEHPRLPTVLVADLAGAERAATAAAAALVGRARTGEGSFTEVALADAAAAMALALRSGLTAPGAALNGAHPGYAIYASADGHVAVGALEPHFFQRLLGGLAVPPEHSALAAVFVTRSNDEWVAWGREHDVPIEAVVTL